MARGVMAVIRLQRTAVEHGWTTGHGSTYREWTRGDERISVAFDARGAVRWAFLDSVPVTGRGRADAVHARLVAPPREG